MLTTHTPTYFDNLKFGIFDSGGRQCNFITSELCAVKLPYVHLHFGAKAFASFLISILVV